jgi:mono/diheme cytochrome c family protein
VIESQHTDIHFEFKESAMTHKWIITFMSIGLGIFPLVNAQTVIDTSRGELLYSTHCIACHSAQIHWRDKKIATNWVTLKEEVGRWQKTAGLGWREEDVTAVARYLNTLYYRFPPPGIANNQKEVVRN